MITKPSFMLAGLLLLGLGADQAAGQEPKLKLRIIRPQPGEAATKVKKVAMTPMEAVESYRRNPNQPCTVEFGIANAGWLDGPKSIDEDPMPPIRAEWDGRLLNGGTFSLYLTGRAIRGLKDVGIELPTSLPAGLVDLQRLSVLCKQLPGKGVRVTGIVKVHRPEDRRTEYSIVVDDPAQFAINK